MVEEFGGSFAWVLELGFGLSVVLHMMEVGHFGGCYSGVISMFGWEQRLSFVIFRGSSFVGAAGG